MVVRTEHFSYMYAAQVVYIMLINGHSAIIHIVRQKVNTIVADPAGYAGSRAATEATTIFNVTTSGAAVYERANNTRTTGDSRLDTIQWNYRRIYSGGISISSKDLSALANFAA